jgi:hypothetical protein
MKIQEIDQKAPSISEERFPILSFQDFSGSEPAGTYTRIPDLDRGEKVRIIV